MSKHARLSPSNHRWVHCPGSVREEANYHDISGKAAIDGTGSHLLLELCLTNNVTPDKYLGRIIGVNHESNSNGWMIHQDRVDRVQLVISYVAERTRGRSFSILSEKRCNPEDFYNQTEGRRFDWYGTCDVVIYYEEGSVEVIDFKDGQGYVEVKDNPQLLAYALGVIGAADQNIRLTIIQPKNKNSIRYVDMSRLDLAAHYSRLKQSASATDDPEALLIPDTESGNGYCKWCKHREKCKALKESRIKEVKVFNQFDNIGEVFGEVEKLSNEDLSKILNTKKNIENFFAEAQEEAKRRLTSGNRVPGYALLPGRNSKEWKGDEDTICKYLIQRKIKKNELYVTKFISPAVLLKSDMLTKAQKQTIEDLYIQVVPGDLTLKQVEEDEELFAQLDEFVIQCDTEQYPFL